MIEREFTLVDNTNGDEVLHLHYFAEFDVYGGCGEGREGGVPITPAEPPEVTLVKLLGVKLNKSGRAVLVEGYGETVLDRLIQHAKDLANEEVLDGNLD